MFKGTVISCCTRTGGLEVRQHLKKFLSGSPQRAENFLSPDPFKFFACLSCEAGLLGGGWESAIADFAPPRERGGALAFFRNF